MHGTLPTSALQSKKHAAKFCSEKFQEAKRRKFFSHIAKYAYPTKTAPAVHALTGYPERTVYDWLSGKSEAPAGVMLMLFGEISRQ